MAGNDDKQEEEMSGMGSLTGDGEQEADIHIHTHNMRTDMQIAMESSGLDDADDGMKGVDPRRQEMASEAKERQEAEEHGSGRVVEEAEQKGVMERIGAMDSIQVAAHHSEAAWGAVGESARESHAGSVWMQAATDIHIHKHTQDIKTETDGKEGWGALGTKRMGERGVSESRQRGEQGRVCKEEGDSGEKRQRSGGHERGQRRASGPECSGEKVGKATSGAEEGWEEAGGDDLAAAKSKAGEVC
jgi:hypothetical protein